MSQLISRGAHGAVEKKGSKVTKIPFSEPGEGIQTAMLNEMIAYSHLMSKQLVDSVSYQSTLIGEGKNCIASVELIMPYYQSNLTQLATRFSYDYRVRWVNHHFPLLLEELDQYHSAGLIHGDIKPDNILLDNYERPTFCDFGSSRLFHQSGMAFYLPTVNFRAPEADVYNLCSTAGDRWSLAASMFYFLGKKIIPTTQELADHHSWETHQLCNSSEYYPLIDLFANQLSASCIGLLRTCLSYDHQRRQAVVVNHNVPEDKVNYSSLNISLVKALPCRNCYVLALAVSIWNRYLKLNQVADQNASLIASYSLANKIILLKPVEITFYQDMIERVLEQEILIVQSTNFALHDCNVNKWIDGEVSDYMEWLVTTS